MPDTTATCLVCQQSEDDVPIVAFRFRGADLWICSQHLPVLIHSPQKLADILPGADGLDAADHKD